MLQLQQQYFSHKAYCTYDNLTIYDTLRLSVLLQQHSECKEPLDYLIHRVHVMGLMDNWYRSTFYDMLKLKKISLQDPNIQRTEAKVITVHDMFWIWMVVVIGLGISGLVFLGELCYQYYSRGNVKRKVFC